VLDFSPDPPARTCGRCGTELAPHSLACPVCSTLLHRERLQQLAESANAATACGDSALARAHWQEALDLVPVHSEQHRQISARLAALADPVVALQRPASDHTQRWWTSGIGVVGTILVLIAGKLKFLLLGLSKISTVASMFGFIAVYWSIYGWPLAVGVAGSIYVHEMGHVAMLRQLGIRAGAPLFIPGVGAMVMLKQHVTDAVTDARIGLAGPLWGLGATIAAWLVYAATGTRIWLAIAEISGFLNLFNLTPIWQLDGSRGFHALSRRERWTVVSTIGVALWLTAVPMLWLVGAVALYRTIRSETGPGHRPTMVTFAGLVLALAWFARTLH
jgi:Zn-dependent protease